MSVFDDFTKKHNMIVCIDSDGCAMDTMNIKHFNCFGPCLVEQWKLNQWREEILKRWNVINLFSMTRGINRFKGLAMMLTEINDKYCKIDGIDALKNWVDSADELSNAALEKITSQNEVFANALSWSKAVNESIKKLPEQDIKPFEGVREAIKTIHDVCDIAVVSSANPEAVRAEWSRFGLLDYVDIICTQDMGSKAFCIEQILKKGYKNCEVLMCGDAPGDQKASEVNNVLYYPILVNHEKESWAKLKSEALDKFVSGNYKGLYEDALKKVFTDNLLA